jgi:protoporphyrinogen oxidase
MQVGPEGTIIVAAEGSEGDNRFAAQHVFSTIPMPHLARIVQPQPPAEVFEAAAGLSYRAMILVYLVLASDRYTEFDAHYFPDREIRITRLSEPKNYSLAPINGRTVLCAELPCTVNDSAWTMSDEDLGLLVLKDLERAHLPRDMEVSKVVTRRLPQAYPVYAKGFGQRFASLDGWAEHIHGLTTLGRQGLFAHDNTHHTLAMAYAASECLGESGTFDRSRWARCRQSFETHVVED